MLKSLKKICYLKNFFIFLQCNVTEVTLYHLLSIEIKYIYRKMKESIIENGCNNTVEVYKKVITFDVTKEQMEYLKSIEDTDE